MDADAICIPTVNLMQPVIDVLMPTYNGARFLAPMLDSVLAQKGTSIVLHARDDSSIDATPEILHKYAQRHTNVQTWGGSRLGVVGNVDALMTRSNQGSSAYFALADQDDIWLSDKIAQQLTLMHKLEKHHGTECPILLCSDALCIDEQGHTIAASFLRQMHIPPEWGKDLRQSLVMSHALGCTCMGNAALRRLALPLPQGENIFMHDWWLLLVASCFGVAYCQRKPLVAYRQHKDNTLGIPQKRGLGQMIQKSQQNAHRTQKQAAEFFKRYAGRMNTEQRDVIQNWAQMPYAPRLYRLWRCWRTGFGKPGVRWLIT